MLATCLALLVAFALILGQVPIATALGLRITLEAMPDAEHRLVARALTDEECRQPAALARVLQRRRSAV